MADESKTIGTIGLAEDGTALVREPIFVSLAKFKNTRYLDIRKYYQKDGEWKPTTKGVTLNQGQINLLKQFLDENKTEISAWFSVEDTPGT